MVRPAGVRTSLVVLEQTMYVGPWQEYRALARARHAEALYATRGPETQVADELERLRRALELVSGELPADKAAKVREALAPVAEPGPPPLPGLSWNPRAAPRRPAPVVRPVKPPPHVLTSLRLDDVRGGAATFLLGTRAPSTDASTAGKKRICTLRTGAWSRRLQERLLDAALLAGRPGGAAALGPEREVPGFVRAPDEPKRRPAS